jgi:hypothetical protein
MRKPATAEPCAGDPHARFGGRGGNFPTPIGETKADVLVTVNTLYKPLRFPGDAGSQPVGTGFGRYPRAVTPYICA